MLTPRANIHGSKLNVKRQKWERAIISKLAAEGLSLSSDWAQIEACLSRVVAPTCCLAMAWQLREALGAE